MPPSDARKPWVIAHRGASGLRPEHTLEAYRLGIAQGADFVEPDLVLTRDGALLIRHDNELSLTTDIADHPEFADRRKTSVIDGETMEGWFSEDFNLAELKTLRARERMPVLRPDSALHDDRYELLTFEELIALVSDEAAAQERPIGIVAELKHPAHFDAIGLPFEQALAPVLARRGRADPLFLASFDAGVLKRLRGISNVRLVQLLEAGATPDLAEIATYADAIGPAKSLIVPRDAEGASLLPTQLVADAHAAGLPVFVWTFRSENLFLPAELRRGVDPAAHGDAAAEYRAFYELGVDAVFSDLPADAVAARA
jgi:glycerophosphoryl diester phosphodiesterase